MEIMPMPLIITIATYTFGKIAMTAVPSERGIKAVRGHLISCCSIHLLRQCTGSPCALNFILSLPASHSVVVTDLLRIPEFQQCRRL